MDIKKRYKYAIFTLIVTFFIFPIAATMAQELEPPTTCDCFGLNVAILPDAQGNWPIETTCIDPETGGIVPCWEYPYASGTGSSAYAQTVPGLGPEDFIVYENDSFSAIQVSEPGEGTNINKACFGQNVYERRVINFTAAPSGDPPKFSYKVNQGGVGWTSLYFKQGNDFCSCPIAGPDFLEDRYVKPVIHFVLFGKTRVRFEINFENCSYRAFQETDENGDQIPEVELTQFPVTNIKITIDGKTGPVRENESLTKCDLGAWVYGTGTCSTRCLGGWCVKIPLGCTP